MSTAAGGEQTEDFVSIGPLLKRLWPSPGESQVTASEIALALSHIFTNSLSPVQTGALLTALHFTGWDIRADVLAKCAEVMREAAAPVDKKAVREAIASKRRKEGKYRGGLCDMVGTGGDSHNTFNVSTTASILCSSLLLIAKHGNRASTSKSGSADILKHAQPSAPILEAVKPSTLPHIYAQTNYAFLFAPVFHPGMRHVAAVRKELGWRTIFNLLGPLSNPLESTSGSKIKKSKPPPSLIEARVLGVARRALGRPFAESLLLSGAKKGLVVCGAEELDEISCAGPTYCWQLVERPNPAYHKKYGSNPHSSAAASRVNVNTYDEDDENYTTSDDEAPPKTVVEIEEFTLEPRDFGMDVHPLSSVSPGRSPAENAETLMSLLSNTLAKDLSPVQDFVLMNSAALFVVSGICEAETSSMGDGDEGEVVKERGPGGGRWKEGVRRATWAISSGKAKEEWGKFVEVTRGIGEA
ncbi:hypothetical protein K402DRAFT_466373 [Aulographum hederae CBS 113979]|uniref:Anthranilate phosphoribosyltransferase n=1 Tax=Aulographum hederae CBS 113979 TaxID=1176131 RepID=A0A6G1GPQ5_9PEZI|nr:hypothetical protein K402DRAFT_466373 [Aulographum hederae CBS 113979]